MQEMKGLELPGDEPTKEMFLTMNDDLSGDGARRKKAKAAEDGEDGDAGGGKKAKGKGKK